MDLEDLPISSLPFSPEYVGPLSIRNEFWHLDLSKIMRKFGVLLTPICKNNLKHKCSVVLFVHLTLRKIPGTMWTGIMEIGAQSGEMLF